ncbi:MAG: hypothetical protein JO345_17410 [Streptosporangiaceae bacterium]|nr:hypothetical protein [Streptosporangiaceae bacterium]
MPMDLMTAGELQRVQNITEELLNLDILTEDERTCLQGLDQRMDQAVKERLLRFI